MKILCLMLSLLVSNSMFAQKLKFKTLKGTWVKCSDASNADGGIVFYKKGHQNLKHCFSNSASTIDLGNGRLCFSFESRKKIHIYREESLVSINNGNKAKENGREERRPEIAPNPRLSAEEPLSNFINKIANRYEYQLSSSKKTLTIQQNSKIVFKILSLNKEKLILKRI